MRIPVETGVGTPIFILSHARTGSTLLRYVLDAHPAICCPPEIALGGLCQKLHYTLSLTATETDDAARRREVTGRVRAHVDRIMGDYAARKQRARWCDKSTNNVEHLVLLREVFPDAQWICLHRNCLDVVHSLMELFRYGYPGHYGEMVARTPDNLVEAMARTWSRATARLVAFEAEVPERCLRVTYEDLVTSPDLAVQRMLEFLDVPFDPELMRNAFSMVHDPGPGDLKVQLTSAIVRGRIGKGGQLPTRRLSDDCRREVDALHAVLGYPPIDTGQRPAIDSILSAAGNVSRSISPERWG